MWRVWDSLFQSVCRLVLGDVLEQLGEVDAMSTANALQGYQEVRHADNRRLAVVVDVGFVRVGSDRRERRAVVPVLEIGIPACVRSVAWKPPLAVFRFSSVQEFGPLRRWARLGAVFKEPPWMHLGGSIIGAGRDFFGHSGRLTGTNALDYCANHGAIETSVEP
jgi:hypothetical protein